MPSPIMDRGWSRRCPEHKNPGPQQRTHAHRFTSYMFAALLLASSHTGHFLHCLWVCLKKGRNVLSRKCHLYSSATKESKTKSPQLQKKMIKCGLTDEKIMRQFQKSSIPFSKILSFYMFEYFAYTHTHLLEACLEPEEARRGH